MKNTDITTITARTPCAPWRVAAGAAALLPLCLAGCGGGGSNGAASTSSAPAPTPAPVLSASAITPDGLTATLAENSATAPVGGTVTYTLTLTNNTSQAIIYSPEYGGAVVPGSNANNVGGYLVLTSPSGGTVYPPQTGGAMPTNVVGGPPVTLAPGQSATGTVTPGNVFSASGAYTATASFSLIPPSSATTPSSSPPPQNTTVGPLTVTVH